MHLACVFLTGLAKHMFWKQSLVSHRRPFMADMATTPMEGQASGEGRLMR